MPHIKKNVMWQSQILWQNWHRQENVSSIPVFFSSNLCCSVPVLLERQNGRWDYNTSGEGHAIWWECAPLSCACSITYLCFHWWCVAVPLCQDCCLSLFWTDCRSPVRRVGRLTANIWVKAAWCVTVSANQGVTTPFSEGFREVRNGTQVGVSFRICPRQGAWWFTRHYTTQGCITKLRFLNSFMLHKHWTAIQLFIYICTRKSNCNGSQILATYLPSQQNVT